MSRSSFILGIALFIVATTMAVMITLRPDSGAPAKTTAAETEKPSQKLRNHSPLPSAPRRAEVRRPSSTLRPRPVASAPRKDSFRVTVPGLEAPDSTPSTPEQQLIARAQKVEQETHEKLDALTEELDLSHAQRAKLFPILARSSSSYDPAMVIGGEFTTAPTEVATVEDEIHGELDPDQQIAYEEEVMDDVLWWQDIIGQIEDDLLTSTGNGSVEPGDEMASEPAEAPAGGIASEPEEGTEPDPAGAGTDVDPGAGSSLLDLLGN